MADPATCLSSNSVLGILRSSENSLLFQLWKQIIIFEFVLLLYVVRATQCTTQSWSMSIKTPHNLKISLLSQRCAHALVYAHKLHEMVQLLVKNSWFWSPQKMLEISAGLLKNVQWCDLNSGPRLAALLDVIKQPPSPLPPLPDNNKHI